MSPDERTLRDLEGKLLDPAFRKSDAVTDLIADDFLEFGSSGRAFDKAAVLEFLRNESPSDSASLSEFRFTLLAPGVALVTFRAVQQRQGTRVESLRSSVWKRDHGGWKLFFHQGTRVS